MDYGANTDCCRQAHLASINDKKIRNVKHFRNNEYNLRFQTNNNDFLEKYGGIKNISIYKGWRSRSRLFILTAVRLLHYN